MLQFTLAGTLAVHFREQVSRVASKQVFGLAVPFEHFEQFIR